MKITATSDIHGAKPPKIGSHEGDILIIAGDLTNRGTINEITMFIWDWDIYCSAFDKVFIIPGNHDTCLTQPEVVEMITSNIPNAMVFFGGTYTYEGVKFGFMPWSPIYGPFEFMADEKFIANNLEKVGKVDVLVTHSPPFYTLDSVLSGEHVGSTAIANFVDTVPPKFHVFGHIHEDTGTITTTLTTFINTACRITEFEV